MKRVFVFKHMYVFYSFVFIAHIINLFLNSDKLNYIVGLLAILMVIVSYPSASRLFKILSGFFMLIGGGLYLSSASSIFDLPAILTNNISLLALLAMLPWMNSVVRSGRFDRSINTLIGINVSDLGKLYVRSSAITLTLAAFLNLSAATISQQVLKENLAHVDDKIKKSFISMSTLRGFSLALLWSPLEILLATSIVVTGVSYVAMLPWLLLIVASVFIIDATWGRFHFKKHSYSPKDHLRQMNTNYKKIARDILSLVAALVLFLILVIIIGNVFIHNFSLVVTLIIFPFSYAWAVIMKRRKSFLVIGWNNWKDKTNAMQNFIILFISLSLFSHSIAEASILGTIQQPMLTVAHYPLVVFFGIQLTFIFLSMFGIHPIATIGILGSVLTTLLSVYNPLSIAIVLVTSAVSTLTLGTYGLVVTLTALNLELNPYRITYSNSVFALLYGSMGSIIAYLLL
ncbi:hypothetical protein GCM10012290_01330 [Halolactibacillus alkaliphilus]|uniref:Uncharacterized protein n=1 Tax=Halolactibacillus alkaliphilus TaxID=442899 RepID=A0A511WZ61_9BACI|nr:hypothetical protein [Halolactibacillus alkaliphilus]GEN55542.1 hypothetical protein HAL01_00060 [Halolactibacillus alkaliphilus]GGN64140.1 hypothetical protein GCM10012290_01330 [Halolactibacillus alkaliphilus]SFO61793.1 hypothetical protein SAMN05720591_101101 [Halolactibacillus alkaliphilus]